MPPIQAERETVGGWSDVTACSRRRIRRQTHDVTTDQHLAIPHEVVEEGGVLVLDGIFLHRPELADAWDLSVFRPPRDRA
jgi:hypothetical protein